MEISSSNREWTIHMNIGDYVLQKRLSRTLEQVSKNIWKNQC